MHGTDHESRVCAGLPGCTVTIWFDHVRNRERVSDLCGGIVVDKVIVFVVYAGLIVHREFPVRLPKVTIE